MNQQDPQFSIVRRGYEPSEVDREVQALRAELGRTQEAIRRLEQQPVGAVAPPEPASFAHLGERVGQILALADAEAAQLRDEARADAEGERKVAEQASVEVRGTADGYAEQRRRDAETEATRIITDAKRAADQERDAAERDSSARRQEAEAVYEQARAKAAAAGADFETTLAERRERTTAEFQEQQTATQAQLEALNLQIEEQRLLGEREHEAAQQEIRKLLQDAEDRAAALVAEARTTADRVRKESDRELAAATRRRDSINQQLGNVRQMLATLTGTSAVIDPLADPLAEPESVDTEAEADAEPGPEPDPARAE